MKLSLHPGKPGGGGYTRCLVAKQLSTRGGERWRIKAVKHSPPDFKRRCNLTSRVEAGEKSEPIERPSQARGKTSAVLLAARVVHARGHLRVALGLFDVAELAVHEGEIRVRDRERVLVDDAIFDPLHDQ